MTARTAEEAKGMTWRQRSKAGSINAQVHP